MIENVQTSKRNGQCHYKSRSIYNYIITESILACNSIAGKRLCLLTYLSGSSNVQMLGVVLRLAKDVHLLTIQ